MASHLLNMGKYCWLMELLHRWLPVAKWRWFANRTRDRQQRHFYSWPRTRQLWGWLWTGPELLRSDVWREHVGHCSAGRGNFALVEKLHSWRRQLSEVEWFRDRLAWKCDQNVSSHVSAVKWACAFADCKYQQTLILVSFEYRWLESRRKQILFLFVELVSFIKKKTVTRQNKFSLISLSQ